jgi:hypothetical protein
VYTTGVRDLHAELETRSAIGHIRPGLESAAGRTEVELDPGR